jgi:AbrB family looped-hinge helix DNA binding protein
MPVTVSEKGWVVIPADLRRKYNLEPGAEVSVVDCGGALALVPAWGGQRGKRPGC